MQTTLDAITTSTTSNVGTTVNKSSLDFSDAHIDYLYEHSFEGMLEFQIEKHLEEEDNHKVEILRSYEEFLKHEKPSKTQYVRVGRCNK